MIDNKKRPVVAKNIIQLRKAKGLDADALAELAGVSSVRMIESGKRLGNVRTLEKIAVALNVTLADLYSQGPETSEADPELVAFLRTQPDGSVSNEEIDLLKKCKAGGRTPTAAIYAALLALFRAMPVKK